MPDSSSGDLNRHALDALWISVNTAFLFRYWSTATEALRKVEKSPEEFAEFQNNTLGNSYVSSVIAGHLDHHNYSGVLLAYAIFDEFMTVLTKNLGRFLDVPIEPSDLRHRGVKRYKCFVHQVCRIQPERANIDWEFLEDFAIVRNAIIHANGNKALLSDKHELDRVVARHPELLKFRHRVRLTISPDFVLKCIVAARETAIILNDLTKPNAASSPGNENG